MILFNFRAAWSSAKAQDTLDTELKHDIALTTPEETLDTELKHAIALTTPEDTLDTELKHAIALNLSFRKACWKVTMSVLTLAH